MASSLEASATIFSRQWQSSVHQALSEPTRPCERPGDVGIGQGSEPLVEILGVKNDLFCMPFPF